MREIKSFSPTKKKKLLEILDNQQRKIRMQSLASRIAEVGIFLGKAIQEIHDKNFAHRDIKPGNIMADGQGSYKLIDFGISCYTGKKDNEDIRCVNVMGTDGYIGPEFYDDAYLRDPMKYYKTSDIYAIGVVLYQLAMTLAQPYRWNGSGFAYVATHTGYPCLDDVISRMLDVNPDTRITPERIIVRLTACKTVIANDLAVPVPMNNFQILGLLVNKALSDIFQKSSSMIDDIK